MKAAVLITGQLRDYKINCINHLKHLIEPNDADVFMYACTQNTLHSCGQSLDQKYYNTRSYTSQEIVTDASEIYKDYLKDIVVNENENLPDDGFGTLGYFRTRMQNQIDNIGHGLNMAMEYSKANNLHYDVIVRCRPDNSRFMKPVFLTDISLSKDQVYSTIFSSGHRDLCFFAMADPDTFAKYCSYKYLEGEDPLRTDSNFTCTEHAWEDYLTSIGVKVDYITDICLTFTGFDKALPVSDFPYRNKDAKLIDAQGNLVTQILNPLSNSI